MFKSTFCSNLQIIITVCPKKFKIFKSDFRLKYVLSLWSWGQRGRESVSVRGRERVRHEGECL